MQPAKLCRKRTHHLISTKLSTFAIKKRRIFSNKVSNPNTRSSASMVQKKDQKAAKRLNFGVAADSSSSEEEDDGNSPIVDVQPHIDT